MTTDITERTPQRDPLGGEPEPVQSRGFGRTLAAQIPLLPAFAALGVMVVWFAHNGGFDEEVWLWGALVMLGLLGVAVAINGVQIARMPRSLKVALVAFAAYTAWSYLSITWAQSPGDAFSGSNRTLLYLIIFCLFAVTPWTPSRVLVMLVAYVISIGVVGAEVLVNLATAHHSASLFISGRLQSPTGYINASAALFTSAALVAVALAARRDLPSVLRGFLLALACGGLQLSLLSESRGWLFLLPFMLAAAIAVVPQRLRTTVVAVLPAAGALAVLPQILHVFESTEGSNPAPAELVAAAQHAARLGLLLCAAVLVVGTVLALIDSHARIPSPSRTATRLTGVLVAALAVGACIIGGLAATHNHPISFIKRQLNGSVTQLDTFRGSHFAIAGTGRFDIWRVSLDAFKAHPIGGLGQDNFIDYYYERRHSVEEPEWTHSLELRLLTHTGIVGFVIFTVFLIAALTAAIKKRVDRNLAGGAIAGVAILPLLVWLIHGSVDWFWEMPALSGPAFAFLAMAGVMVASPVRASARRRAPRPALRVAAAAAGVLVFVVAEAALAFPYLSARESSIASDIQNQNSGRALQALSTAADLNPLSSEPGRLGGLIALRTGRFTEAQTRFEQAIAREPGAWLPWLGAGLAASALGNERQAHRDFVEAARINIRQAAVAEALQRVNTRHPLTPPEAFKLLAFVD